MLGAIVSTVGGYAVDAAKTGIPFAGDFLKGAISNYWNDKALNRSYAFAEKYARNSPTWTVEGLREAGLNPLLAVTKGFSGGSPSLHPQSVDTNSRISSTDFSTNQQKRKEMALADKQLELIDAEIEGQKIRNENEKANRGLDGKWGAISRLISETENRAPSFTEYLKNSPLITIEKKANANIESYTDDERKALILHEILQSHGYNDVDARHEGGEEFWEHLESAWAKRRRNVRASRKR